MKNAVMGVVFAVMASSIAAKETDHREHISAVYEAGHFFVLSPVPSGQPLRLLVDTGGGGARGLFLLEASAVKRLGQKPYPCASLGTGISLVNVPSMTTTLPSPARETPCHATAIVVAGNLGISNLDGLLGAGYLPGQTWTFDYPRGQLWREASHWTPTHEYHALVMELPHDHEGQPAGLPRIHLRIDGEDLPMLLDTGATAKPTAAGEKATGMSTVLGYGVTSYAPRRLIDRWHARHPDWPLVENGDDLIPHMRLIRVPEVHIAGWSIGPVWFTERADRNIDGLENYMAGPVQGSAGANIYQHFVMTLDYKEGKAYLACATDCRPSSATSPAQTVGAQPGR